MAELEPFAQSMTTCRPSSRRPSTEASSDRHHRSMSSTAAAGSAVGTARPSARAAAAPESPTTRPAGGRARPRGRPRPRRRASRPPAAKNLMPLSPNGLCEAEITAPGHVAGRRTPTRWSGSAPRRAPRRRRRPTVRPAGQGRFDPRPGRTRVATDDEAGPAPRPRRAREPRRDRGPRPARRSARRPGREHRRFRSAGTWPARLSLGVLRRLAGLLEAVLLAFLLPRVAGEEAGLLEVGAQLGVELDERTGDAVAQGAGLARGPAAVERGVDVVDLGRSRSGAAAR